MGINHFLLLYVTYVSNHFSSNYKGHGPKNKIEASGINTAIIGGAIWTPLMGYISVRSNNMALAMIIPLKSYILVSYYALLELKPSGQVYNNSDEKAIAVN